MFIPRALFMGGKLNLGVHDRFSVNRKTLYFYEFLILNKVNLDFEFSLVRIFICLVQAKSKICKILRKNYYRSIIFNKWIRITYTLLNLLILFMMNFGRMKPLKTKIFRKGTYINFVYVRRKMSRNIDWQKNCLQQKHIRLIHRLLHNNNTDAEKWK